jgi:hypothetical protein
MENAARARSIGIWQYADGATRFRRFRDGRATAPVEFGCEDTPTTAIEFGRSTRAAAYAP